MGIPYYFKELITKNRNITTNITECDRLFLDYNSVIHTCAATVVSKLNVSEDQLLPNIFKYISYYTDEIIKKCKPKQLLYIGIDGVAPLAKMSQQRKRRYISALRNNLINTYKKNNNIPYVNFDSNCITPGTSFMNDLSVYLKDYYRSSNITKDIIIDDSSNPGEGEHKIIKYIKNNSSDSKYKDVIYGLDADLIMLALSCNKSQIYLMREIQTIDKSIYYKYVDIDILKIEIQKYLYGNTNINKNIKDYIFICFMLGNDFMPHFPSLSIKNNGLDIVCNIYRNIYKNLGVGLIDDNNKINFNFLKEFIDALSKGEYEKLIQYSEYHYNQEYKPQRNVNHISELDRYIYYIDNISTNNTKPPIDYTDPLWKHTYYKLFMNIEYNNLNLIDNICECYLQGLVWNTEYYFEGKFTNIWYYKYNMPPLLVDLNNYLNKNKVIGLVSMSDINFTEIEQLLIVLPALSHNLLPEDIRIKVIDLKYAHMYPRTFQLISYLKTQVHECVPILPPIKVSKIKEIIAQ